MVAPEADVLNRVATRVSEAEIGTPTVKKIVAKLFAAAGGQIEAGRADAAKGRTRRLVGLAAPQIGVPRRIIVVDTKVTPERKGESHLECLINPEIVWRSRETTPGREGCFSAGPVWGIVRRPIAVKIRALTPEGKAIEQIFEGFTARIVQHEIDHLDGVRFPERIRSDRHRHWVHAEELFNYAKRPEGWPCIVTRAEWEAFKRGELLY
jgi:peptide deformylase